MMRSCFFLAMMFLAPSVAFAQDASSSGCQWVDPSIAGLALAVAILALVMQAVRNRSTDTADRFARLQKLVDDAKTEMDARIKALEAHGYVQRGAQVLKRLDDIERDTAELHSCLDRLKGAEIPSRLSKLEDACSQQTTSVTRVSTEMKGVRALVEALQSVLQGAARRG